MIVDKVPGSNPIKNIALIFLLIYNGYQSLARYEIHKELEDKIILEGFENISIINNILSRFVTCLFVWFYYIPPGRN